MQDRLDVTDIPRTTVEVVREQVIPVVGDTDCVRPTVPVKPFTAATMIMEVPVAPASTAMAVWPATIVKSWTVKITTAVWDRDPLVPVMVTV